MSDDELDHEYAVLEATTFRVPYEELNSHYRSGHKNMEKATTIVKKLAQQVQQAADGKGESIPVEQVKGKFVALMTAFRELESTYKRTIGDQSKIIETMKIRVHELKAMDEVACVSSVESAKMKIQNKKKCMRYVVNYLLRCGHIESAKKIAAKYQICHMVDIDIFVTCNEIKQSLLNGKTEPCLAWIDVHRSKLKRMKSRLEAQVRMQDVIDLVLEDKCIDALKYVRKHISPYSKTDGLGDIQMIMGVICQGREMIASRFQDACKPSRWETIAETFVEQFHELYQLPRQSQFSMCLHVGLSAFKTPSCKSDEGEDRPANCIICSPKAWPIAENLPNANVGQSRILCSFSGDVCDETNEPFRLPSGLVVGSRALELAMNPDGETLTDQHTGATIPLSQCERLYFL